MTVLATAGHVDHGKSTFVSFLTSQETDRLPEEKNRGLTINLGYTFFNHKKQTYSIVDVPGHSDFFKNTMSGFSNADLILFIIDASQGWSAQSEQHFNALTELGKKNFIFVYTKTDLINSPINTDDLDERLKKIDNLNYTVIKFSIKDSNKNELVEQIVSFIKSCNFKNKISSMWIDRSFSLEGVGTVITGTASSSFKTDKIYYPIENAKLEIKEIQNINKSYIESINSKRIALSLKKSNKNIPKRGNLISNTNIEFTNLIFVKFNKELGNKNFTKGTKRLFIGTTSILIKNIWGIKSKKFQYGLIELKKEMPFLKKENFVIQNTENNLFLGGKFYFFINNQSLKKKVINSSKNKIVINSLFELFSALEKDFTEKNEATFEINNWRIKEELKDEIEKDIKENYKKINKSGFENYMGNKYFLDSNLLEKLVESLGDLQLINGQIKLKKNGNMVDIEIYEEVKELLGPSLDVNEISLDKYDKEKIKSLFINERIYRISKNLIITDFHFNQILAILKSLPAEFSVSDFKEKTKLSRKYTIPILELLDKKLITAKVDRGGKRKKLL